MCGLNEQPRLELALAGNWEFTEPGPSVHGVSQDRGGRVGGLWAAAGPEVRVQEREVGWRSGWG